MQFLACYWTKTELLRCTIMDFKADNYAICRFMIWNCEFIQFEKESEREGERDI